MNKLNEEQKNKMSKQLTMFGAGVIITLIINQYRKNKMYSKLSYINGYINGCLDVTKTFNNILKDKTYEKKGE